MFRLTEDAQLGVGVYDSVAILCSALVHPRVLKRQAVEAQLFPVELGKTQDVIVILPSKPSLYVVISHQA